MKKIRLLHFFAPLRFGGGETFLVHFLKASAPHFENEVALFSESEDFSRELPESVTKIPVLRMRMTTGNRGQYIKLFFAILMHPGAVAKVLREHDDYDFIVGHGFPFNIVLPLLKYTGFIGRRRKMIYFQYHRLMHSSGSALQRWVYKGLLRSFDLIVADSEEIRRDILAVNGDIGDKIVIYSVGLDFAYVKELAAKGASENIVLPPGRVTAVYPARFIPHKNHKIFLKIFSRLKEEHAPDLLTVVFSGGESGIRKGFKEALASGGFEKNALMPDALRHDDLLHLIGKSDVCIFPSLEEGFGLGVLEALILGVPVLTLHGVTPLELEAFTIASVTEDEFVKKACAIVRDEKGRWAAHAALAEKYSELREKFDLERTSIRLRIILDGILAAPYPIGKAKSDERS